MGMTNRSPITKDARKATRLVKGGERDLAVRKVQARRAARREANCLTRRICEGAVDPSEADFSPSHILSGRDIA